MRHRTFFLSWVVLASSAAGGAAFAASPDPRFTEYLKSAETRLAVAKAVQTQVAGLPIACKDVKLLPDSKFSVLAPVEFASLSATTPSKGVWLEYMTVESCGVKRRHNIQTIANDGKIEMYPRLTGATIASLAVQRDAEPLVKKAAASKAEAACEKAAVVDTTFIAYAAKPDAKPTGATDADRSKGWREEWTVWSCGKEIVVPVIFAPDDKGTAITAKSSEARVK